MESGLKEKIKKSGNNLHFKVIETLTMSGWKVNISPYYIDDITDRPREIDIIAKKQFFVNGIPDKPHPHSIDVLLFIECKHFRKEVAFWNHPFDNFSDFKFLIKSKDIDENDIYNASDHHYNQTFIGKLFTSEKEDDVFDALTQPVKALIDYRHNHSPIGLLYPVCIYEGPGIYFINELNDLQNLDGLFLQKNALVEINYSWRPTGERYSTQERFGVDFIKFDEIQSFIVSVVREGHETANNMTNKFGGAPVT